MTKYIEVAQALVTAGYLSDADIQAATDVLADALIIEVAEDAQDAAADDYATQEDIVAEAEVWEAEDAAVGDFNSMEDDEDVIDEAIDKELEDEDVMAGAEDEIEAAYVAAAAALLSADLIDEANLDDVAIVIAIFNINSICKHLVKLPVVYY